MYLYYATTIGDFKRVIEHWIIEEEWVKAIEVISRQVTISVTHLPLSSLLMELLNQSDLELYYRFGPVLMHQAPKETVDSWLRQPSLDPLRLIPSFLQLQHCARDPLSPNHAIRFLNYVIFEQRNTSPTIHNLLITFYVSPSSVPSYTQEDDGPLLRFLSTAPTDPITGKPYYDLDYALRICKFAGRTQPCVHIYSKMGLWENSVDLALEKGDLELAKINADMPEDDQPLRKKLWLKIARYVVQDKKDIKSYVVALFAYFWVLIMLELCSSLRMQICSKSKIFCLSSLISLSSMISRKKLRMPWRDILLKSIRSRSIWMRLQRPPKV